MVLSRGVSPDSIGGDVDEGYGKLADVFRRNMSSGQEVGAAVAVYRDGRKVVDVGRGSVTGPRKRRGSKTPSSPCSQPRKALPR